MRMEEVADPHGTEDSVVPLHSQLPEHGGGSTGDKIVDLADGALGRSMSGARGCLGAGELYRVASVKSASDCVRVGAVGISYCRSWGSVRDAGGASCSDCGAGFRWPSVVSRIAAA